MRRFLHIAPSAVLFYKANPVVCFDAALRDLVLEMYRIMYDERGVGLAAPQVGVSVRVAVIDLQGRSLRQEREEEMQENAEEQVEEQVEELVVAQTEEETEEALEDDCRESREPFAMVNPEIVSFSEDRRVYEEGCLSFPDLLVKVERPREVAVRYWDIEGIERLVKASGLLSVCLQHELDHLEGRTIVASLSRLKRSMVLRKFAKQAQQEGRGSLG